MKRITVLGAALGLLISLTVPLAAFAYYDNDSHSYGNPSGGNYYDSYNHNTDHTPPKLTYLHIGSSESDPSVAAPGDTVTISLTANEKVRPIVLVESHSLFAKATNTGGNSWDASYTVDPRDPLGTIDYLIALTDQSDNVFICTSAKLPYQIVPRCPTTDGSSVTIGKNTPPADTQAPTIAPHEDVSTAAIDANGAVVAYTAPTATDNVDGTDAVSCSPASGSTFPLGATTVTCNAHDAAGNNATPSTFSVNVTDQAAPTIAPHDNVSVHGTASGAVVSYAIPTSTDNVDGTDAVSCSPASGSTFAVGTTTVTCNAHDAAGNNAPQTSFDVGVYVVVPVPYTMASQPDDSTLCSPDWENCFTGGSGQAAIKLGQGSSLGSGTLLSVTIAKDESSPFVTNPWIVGFLCFTDAAYTTTCPDWVQGNSWNGFRPYLVTESATSTQDNKFWTGYFLDPSHESQSGTNPISFNPNYYYELIINDNGWNIGAYGNAAQTIPYYTVTGMQ